MVEAQKELEATKKVYFTWSLHDHDVRKHGREEGIAIGRSEGREQAKIENARNMLADNLPLEKIAQYTGLTIKDVQALADNTPVMA